MRTFLLEYGAEDTVADVSLLTPFLGVSTLARGSFAVDPTIQLVVQLLVSHRDLQEAQQAAVYQGLTYEIVAAAPFDAPLLVLFDALGASGTTANVEPYVPAILLGSSVVDMTYIPSSLTQQPTQSMDVDMEPDLSIETPADPALFKPPIEIESEKKRDIQKREEVETKKKREQTETKKKGDVQEKEESKAKKKCR